MIDRLEVLARLGEIRLDLAACLQALFKSGLLFTDRRLAGLECGIQIRTASLELAELAVRRS